MSVTAKERFLNIVNSMMPGAKDEEPEEIGPTDEELRREDIAANLQGRARPLIEELTARVDAADMLAEQAVDIADIKRFQGAKMALRDFRDYLRDTLEKPKE